MTSKRNILAAAVATALGMALLSGCTPSATEPTASATATPTPSPTTGAKVPPPANEEEATTAAQTTIQQLLKTQAEVSAAGGTDTTPYETLATGKALTIYVADAAMISRGPILNADKKNVEGQSKVTGTIKFEPQIAYGQEYEGTPNGLVIVPGCQDMTDLEIVTADGTPAWKNPTPRVNVEYHVIYNTTSETWMVSDRLDTGGTC